MLSHISHKWMVVHLCVCVHVESKIHAEQMTYHTQNTNVDVLQCGSVNVSLDLLVLRRRCHTQDTHDVCHLCGYACVAKDEIFQQKSFYTEGTRTVVHLCDASYEWLNHLSERKPSNMSHKYVASNHHEAWCANSGGFYLKMSCCKLNK